MTDLLTECYAEIATLRERLAAAEANEDRFLRRAVAAEARVAELEANRAKMEERLTMDDEVVIAGWKKAEAQRDAALALLREVQFMGDYSKCPICDQYDPCAGNPADTVFGHAPDCRLAALLAAEGGGDHD